MAAGRSRLQDYGAGYVEESILPRLYRQAPLNSIWEGSGNLQCLDVLRALGRDEGVREALDAELTAARGADAALDREVQSIMAMLDDAAALEPRSRELVERLARCRRACCCAPTTTPAWAAPLPRVASVARAAGSSARWARASVSTT